MSQPRKWSTFSIRDLIWLTLFAAIAVCWYRKNRSYEELRRELFEQRRRDYELSLEMGDLLKEWSRLDDENRRLQSQISDLQPTEGIAK